MRFALLFGAGVTAACVQSATHPCAGDLECPAHLVCDDIHTLCVEPDQLAQCVGAADGAACEAGGPGRCDREVCLPARCGDGWVEDGVEACDAGDANADVANAPCRTDCTLPRCGDLLVDTARGEACDDGNLASGDGCAPDCASAELCGNAIVDAAAGEVCDDGGTAPGDGCDARCGVEDAAWSVLGDPPLAADLAMAYDAARGETVMVVPAATAANGARLETWVLRGNQWRRAAVAGPEARTSAAMTYDPIRRRVVLFGGVSTEGDALGDTWVWNGGAWARVSVSGPAPRLNHTMAWDPLSQRVLLFGGHTFNENHVDTWAWDGATWAPVATATSPTAGQVRMAADVRTGRVLAVEPTTVEVATKVWSWDGTAWTQTTTVGPESRLDAAIASTPFGGVVFGGGRTYHNGDFTTPVYLSDTWFSAGPGAVGVTPGAGLAFALDADAGRVVRYGGRDASSVLGITEVSDGTTWAPPPLRPAPRELAAATYVASLGKVLMFGGRGGATSFDDTWLLDDAGWTPQPGTGPSARQGAAIAYDAKRDQVVLVGGLMNTTLPDAWTWTPSQPPAQRWQQLGSAPPARYNAAIAYDAAREQIVVFGGFNGSTSLDDTWLWDGATWTRVAMAPAVAPSPRASAAMAYDPIAQKVILFGGGAGTAAEASETWEWDGTAWTQRAHAVHPPALSTTAMTWDPHRKKIVLFGGRTPLNAMYGGTWELDASGWTRVSPTEDAVQMFRHALVADVARRRVLAFGGRQIVAGPTPLLSNAAWSLAWTSDAPVESCASGIDQDGDGLAGCADSDCWPRCAPMCPPMTTCAATAPRCGDGICSAAESCRSCPADCPLGGQACPARCGDFRCEGTETALTCRNDCP